MPTNGCPLELLGPDLGQEVEIRESVLEGNGAELAQG
jgi:hypothetical protein